MQRKAHWETIFKEKAADSVSWYQVHLAHSLRLIERSGVGKDGAIIDVGAGTSTLVDDLLAQGYRNVTALDISAGALQVSRDRLGPQAGKVNWLEADILDTNLPVEGYEVWHDRAVFHFLTNPAERQRYVKTATAALRAGGSLIIATFAADGPEQCSGLLTVRYTPEGLSAEFGAAFRLVECVAEAHQTPWQSVQNFVYCRLQRPVS
ncbi:MAG TPA: class I SAM-dependent methyltransferase [Aggregatilineales bacterium]|nr:class I SAM-dependent methyltransferase [Aggregatilineales bacterium]